MGLFCPKCAASHADTDLVVEHFSSSLKSPFHIAFQCTRQCILGIQSGSANILKCFEIPASAFGYSLIRMWEGRRIWAVPKTTEACLSGASIPLSDYTGAKKGRCGPFIPLAVYYSS